MRASEWQPIATAPRDGTSVLVWDGRCVSEDCYEVITKDLDEGWRVSITHWMPMPKPPTLNAPSLRSLSAILRNRALWPEGFVWDYGNCETCAMGLAARMWKGLSPTTSSLGPALEISSAVTDRLFLDVDGSIQRRKRVKFDDITPEHVADEIDRYLAFVA